ncbi:MAG: hypothetical protein ACRDA2_04385 [Cetobacterium sp.]|uniref:hypothetical protein n=1 Tax=Cetobacterium TaxID=180162 RepID=UPI001F06D1E9|nr:MULTISPECIES: hypothetical protein [Cetobacterium]MCX3066570.1 hypothetical protein [Cetobacterium somerae]UPO98170.1 hypothetical protein MKD34_10935 [Cetobacterium somerae]
MKKLVLFIAILSLVGCMKKEVKFGDENLELKGTKLYYKDKLFTGFITQEVPFTDKVIKVEYINGVIKTEK